MTINSFTKQSATLYELDLGRADGAIIIDLLLAAVDPTDPAQIEKLRLVVQALIDERVKVRDLPDDDLAKDIDPARPDFFWEGKGGNKNLVARSVEVFIRHNPNGTEFDFGFSKPGLPFQFIDIDLSGVEI